MAEPKRHKLLLLGTIVAYFLITIEIVVMISPFALYFYSVYGPLLEYFSSNPYLSWTTEFFLPHMVFMDDPVILGISYLQVLLVVGLVLFFSAAIPLYYGRFTRKGVVQMSFYSKIRHPQYLFLAISGFGLLLYWPRFIVLVMYVTMLFVYYLLARNEEWRMKQEVPDIYEKYMAHTPMFLPGEPGGKLYAVLFSWIQPKWLGLLATYGVSMALAIFLAVGIRAYSVNHLPVASFNTLSMLPVFPRSQEEVTGLYKTIQDSEEVRAGIEETQPNLAYIFPGDFFLTAIVTDQDRRWFPEDFVQHIPEVFEWHQHKFRGGLGQFFQIFHNFFSTLGTIETDYYVERLVFVRVSDQKGEVVNQGKLFALGTRRTPVLIVDFDTETGRIISVFKATGANKWGTTPMPTF